MNVYNCRRRLNGDAWGRYLRQLLPVLGCFLLAACATSPEPVIPEPEKTENELIVESAELFGFEANELDLGVLVYLPKLAFEFNSAALSPAARDKLAFIVAFCNSERVEDRKISVSGHSDSKGTEKQNLAISRARAEKVAEVLIEQGIDRERILVKWFGETRPLVPNTLSDGHDNPEGRAVNRRVDFLVMNP